MKKTKKLLVGLALVLGITVVTAGLRSTSLFDVFEKKLSHGLYNERPAAEEIVIVEVDEQTLQDPTKTGLGNLQNWPRSHYAMVLENLRQAGAHSVFLDFLYNSNPQSVSMLEIAQLLQENREAPLTVLSSHLLGESPSDDQFIEALNPGVFLFKSALTTAEVEENRVTTTGENASLDKFAERASSGFSDVVPEGNEQAVYAVPIGLSVNGAFEESISLKLARDFLYRDEASSGDFNLDGSLYQFDSVRNIPNEQGQMLINYAVKPYDYPRISFVNVFKNNFDASEVNGKIVMVGPTASILQDRQFTPINSEIPMPGVEIQANAVQTVLDNAFLQRQSGLGFLLMVGLLTAVSVLAFLYLPVLAGSGVLVLELILFPFLARFLFGRGVIMDLIWPIFALITSYLAVLAYRNFTEFKEKREIRNAFSHYVSPDLVKEIADNPDVLRLGGERRELTAMFLDFENFTTLSESLKPEEVVNVINVYFDALANVIMDHGGTVDKFEGDAIMALFGAPLPNGTHAVNACTAALDLRNKLKELNAETGHNLNIRIGIASGPAVVGNMGSKTRFDYTAMGDTVNTASRLEGGNKFYGTRILVNPGTMAAAQKWIAFRRVDTVRLKGKTQAIHIYEIMGLMETLTREGQLLIGEWHEALDRYRNQEWDDTEARIKKVMEKLPNDGPSQTYLKRIAELRVKPPQGWDGTWTFDKK